MQSLINLSIVLNTIDVKLIGRSFSTKFAGPFFDNRNAIDIIYLDFQKAFDTVPHQRLINKLQSYGICGNILWWIRDFRFSICIASFFIYHRPYIAAIF
jgi:hypothetical protein